MDDKRTFMVTTEQKAAMARKFHRLPLIKKAHLLEILAAIGKSASLFAVVILLSFCHWSGTSTSVSAQAGTQVHRYTNKGKDKLS